MNNAPKRVAFHTLGCKVNQHDSAIMAALFQDAGYEVVPFDKVADVYVINTCTVTHLSDRKSRQMIRRAAGENPEATVVVCGCYAQTAQNELAALDEVDLIIGTNERHKVVEAVETFRENHVKTAYMPEDDEWYWYENLPHERVSGMTRAYVKIQEGCDQFCAYCIIPYARGPLRSRSEEDTIAEIRELVAQGYKEVILTGIHIGAYGRGVKDNTCDLTGLCRRILDETDIARLRIGSLEGIEVTDELITMIAENPRMAQHLHLPLQSGCDRTLAEMRRPYDTEAFRDMMRRIRQRVPNIAITTDLMVGFPGETEEDFKESLVFCNDIAFAGMHIFKYSMRNGTPAAAMTNQIDPQIKERRAKQMADVAQKNKRDYEARFVGQTLRILVEEQDTDGLWMGHSSNYLMVHFPGEAIASGDFVDVRITAVEKNRLLGEMINQVKEEIV
ncbi:MAG: tRNA (N(6)-L-threonylcarbamoyladenosine(37)-C(2))-methylthiotransferase MtaB [Peptococcaceae bacterium]|nr:tRNA (N(6)-L-threonylcarbamoyladenosine(37)-C(2))-methylthiotransferase MtaB [Peptococcaceae bacterium]